MRGEIVPEMTDEENEDEGEVEEETTFRRLFGRGRNTFRRLSTFRRLFGRLRRILLMPLILSTVLRVEIPWRNIGSAKDFFCFDHMKRLPEKKNARSLGVKGGERAE